MIPNRLQDFLSDIWSFEHFAKYGPSDPIVVNKILQKYKKIWEHPGNIFFISENQKNVFVESIGTDSFSKSVFFEISSTSLLSKSVKMRIGK